MLQGGIDEPSSKKIHPFFTKTEGPEIFHDVSATPTATASPVATGSDASAPENNIEEPRRKRRKTDTSLPQDESEPKKPRRKRKGAENSLTGAILNHLTKPDQPTTILPTVHDGDQRFPSPPLSEVSPKESGEATGNTGKWQFDVPATDPTTPNTPIAVQPKKVLKFNPRTGTFGSPPKAKLPIRPAHLVCIKYGKDLEDRKRIGERISLILTEQLSIQDRPITNPKSTTKTSKTKGTHPFFSKSKPQAETDRPTDPIKKTSTEKHSVFLSTPISPRRPKNVFTSGKAIQFGIRSSGTKIPGAMHPLWPPKGMCHIRGDDIMQPNATSNNAERQNKKSKGLITTVVDHESILQHITNCMDLTTVRNTLPRDPYKFDPAPIELRLPERHFESGQKLRRRIRSQLQSRFIETPVYEDCDFGPDELAGPPASRVHPALDWLYRMLGKQLSAYDRSSCENLAWVHKYAPNTAEQVLQSGREALLLSQWLQALRVESVESASSNDDKTRGKVEGGAKKKRKKNKMDGFVVNSDDEMDLMDEISGDENDWASSPAVGFAKKSVIRSGALNKAAKDRGRLSNMILLSGPHGCGKTAAVYAVAKQLDFEVFEINSSSRRSGRDILEKVGDMTRNHLVQHNRTDSGTIDPEEVASDIKAGKQGMMTNFFKPKEAIQSKKVQKKQLSEGAAKETKPAPTKSQKQSLILLEEVDILFEEDKQFWATLMGLIAQSKRPFIMTCNDESLVPIQTLNLHGIFRFSPVPPTLATDLCVLIAANEGHALQRSAVEMLYSSRKNDLRATITELNYWCQLGVGDRRGGFDWFYLRWPKGCDLDENGDVVRVISQDTYQKGMGWLTRDEIATTLDPLRAEEAAMEQTWENWQLDLGDWCNTIDINAWAVQESKSESSAAQRLSMLAAYDTFCDAMSAADLCSSGAYGTKLQEPIDSTLPDPPSDVRDDYIIGQVFLHADPVKRQVSPNMAITTSLKSLARATLCSSISNQSTNRAVLGPLDEDRTTSILDASFHNTPFQMVRYDVAVAFDPIAVAPKYIPTTHLDPSVFDRTLNLIVLDVAPWVRGIVAYEHQLMQKRLRLSNLLSEGGKRKRMRNTRSALSALEGGERRMTRREKHFGECLTMSHVMRTGGDTWAEIVLGETIKSEAEESTTPSSPTSDELSQ